MQSLCKRHHHLRHDLGYTIEHLGGGDYRWTKTNGRTYDVHTDDLLNDDDVANPADPAGPGTPPDPDAPPSNVDPNSK
jgi:hypothetical protein